MPGFGQADINIVDVDNSSTTLLPPLGVFTGVFTDVTGYSSISVSCLSDVSSQFSGLSIQWSTDGINNNIAPQEFTFDPVSVSQDGFTVHAIVRAKFFRIVYANNVFPQTSFTLTTLLRKGSVASTVRSMDPVNTFITNIDVQETQAILSGVGRFNPEQVLLPVMDDLDYLSGRQVYVFVSPRPAFEDGLSRKVTSASLTPVKLTTFGHERGIYLSIHNDVTRGNLYIQLNSSSGLTVMNYDYLIPPGHTWQDPGQFGSGYSGNIYGVWDEITDSPGFARYTSWFYG